MFLCCRYKSTVTKQSHYRYHTARSHKIFLYLIVLMLIYCRYKSTVTELIPLQILHCTPLFNIFISHCPNFCVLQIQIYCHESNHRSWIILSYAVSSCISFNDPPCVRVNLMLFILCIFLHSMFCTNKMC
jgi:hypothetical protein